MTDGPLHPMVVHFPIVFSVLLPIFVTGALVAIRRGARPARAWAFPLAVSGALLVSGIVATRTGEAEEERVEQVVSESIISEHEAAAERFLVLSGIVLLIGLAGFAPGVLGAAGRGLTTVGSLVVVFAGFQVGKAGGELVYRHDAASVYTTSRIASGQAYQTDPTRKDHDHEDD